MNVAVSNANIGDELNAFLWSDQIQAKNYLTFSTLKSDDKDSLTSQSTASPANTLQDELVNRYYPQYGQYKKETEFVRN